MQAQQEQQEHLWHESHATLSMFAVVAGFASVAYCTNGYGSQSSCSSHSGCNCRMTQQLSQNSQAATEAADDVTDEILADASRGVLRPETASQEERQAKRMKGGSERPGLL